MPFRPLFLTLVLLAPPRVAGAQTLGAPLPSLELDDFKQTPASSFEDFTGRAVLIEFFAFS